MLQLPRTQRNHFAPEALSLMGNKHPDFEGVHLENSFLDTGFCADVVFFSAPRKRTSTTKTFHLIHKHTSKLLVCSLNLATCSYFKTTPK